RHCEVVSDVVGGLAGQDMVTVTGPGWQLKLGSPVHREARLAAVADATQRGREYAEAFGGTITGLIEAADTGLLALQPEPGGFRAGLAAPAAAPAYQAAPEFDFELAKQTVSAEIEARFTMTAPSFGK